MKVAAILATKGKRVVTIPPTGTIAEMSRLIRENRIGAAVVSSDGSTVEGIITERDIAYSIDKHGAGFHALPVSAVMTRAVYTCAPEDDVARVASTMLSRNFRHIPVVEGHRLAGMVSIRDVLNVQVGELLHETALLRVLAAENDREPQDR